MGTDRPLLIAHRGFAEEFPENTMTAVRNAVRYADGVEVDVHRCGSGELIVIHDGRVGPVWRRKRVDGLSHQQLADVRPTADDTPVPELTEVLDVVPSDQVLIVELKAPAAAHPATELLRRVDGRVVVSSANRTALSIIERSQFDVSTAFVHIPSVRQRGLWPVARRVPRAIDTLVDVGELVRDASALGCDELHVRYELCLHTDIVDRAHANDLSIGAWTVRSPDVYEDLATSGVDLVFADTWRVRTD